MMKVFICPECGWMRVVSRRKDVECFKCGNEQMTLAKVDFDAFTSMSEEERKDYANGWENSSRRASTARHPRRDDGKGRETGRR